jgi:hypothetical protein
MVGLILGLGTQDELGGKLGEFAKALSDFFNRVFEYIPYFPDLDVRVRFVILSWAVPTIFTILFLWFTRSAVANLLTVVLYICNFCFFYEVAYVSYGDNADAGTYSLIPLSILGWIGIGIYEFFQWKTHREIKANPIEYIVDCYVNYFVDGVMPNRHNEGKTLEDLEAMLDARRESLVTHPAEPTIFNLGTCGVLFVGCIFILLYSTGPLVAPQDRVNIVIEWFINVICILMMLGIIAVAVMILVPAAREPFVEIRISIRRFLLKVMLLILDCLYVPICQAMIDVCYGGRWKCPVGQYLNWDHVGGEGFWDSLYDRNVTCDACEGFPNNWTEDLFATCNVKCNGYSELHNNISTHLLFNRDVMGMTGPLMVYAGLAVVIGQPVWWAYLISGNKDIAWTIPCYGETSEQKWAWLSEKLVSPGVFLFYQFRHNRTWWGWLLPITKILTVILAQIAEFTTGAVSWAVLVLYIAILALNIKFWPYRFKVNNIFDVATTAANVVLTILALAAFHSSNFPDGVMTPITIIVVVLPLLALGYGFVRKVETVEQPGAVQAFDEEGNPTESIVSEWSVQKDLIWLLPIWNSETTEEQVQEKSSELVESVVAPATAEEITITSEFVNGNLVDCQTRIDNMCDAYSTNHVVSMLRIASAIACICAGWFFGGVSGTRLASKDIDC